MVRHERGGVMARILGVNGIWNWSWSKHSFTDRFLLELEKLGHETVDVHYARMWAVLAYFNSAVDRRAMAIIRAYQPGDHVVAHSFGCYATIRAMQKGARFGKVFLFAGACEPNFELPAGACDHLYNIHSSTDRALMAGDMLPFHLFGPLGLTGYAGNDFRVENVCADGMDHSTYSEEPHLSKWVQFIHARI